MDYSTAITMLIEDSKDDSLSLKTLKPKEKEKILEVYQKCRKTADSYYKDTIESKVILRQNLYDSPKELYKQKFPSLSELTDWISRDIKTAIDWIIPSLIEVFTGTEDPCDIKGCNINDDNTAQKIQELVKYQVSKKNDFFMFLYSFLREGLITNEGVAKVYWKRDEERTEMEVMLDETNIQFLMQEVMDGSIEIKDIKQIDDSMAVVKYDEIHVKCNYPVLENMTPSELRFTPDNRDIRKCKFVAHRKIVRGDYLKRKEDEGVFSNVDEALEALGDNEYTTFEQKVSNNGLEGIGKFEDDGDKASKKVELYEAYLDVDYNNDGRYEHIIVHAVDDVLLSVQDNTYEEMPFFMFAPEYDPYTPFGKSSYADVLEQLQDLKTALIRQVIIAVAKNNSPQKFINGDKVDVDALMAGDEVVLCEDIPSDSIYIAGQIPISQLTMDMINYAQTEIESQSGSTKYNQGLDGNSLNKTATGINAILGQADKKIRLTARIFAETAWVPIIKYIIKLNQRFLDPVQMVRLNDEMVQISADELDIDYDLTVNTGQGAGTKEAQMSYLINIMQTVFPTLQQVGVVDANSWYEITKDLLNKMGIRNVENYLIDPNSEQYKQTQQQALQKQQQAEQIALQLKQQELQAKVAPKLSANYKDLPLDAKQQALQKYGGLTSTPQALNYKEVLDSKRWGNN